MATPVASGERAEVRSAALLDTTHAPPGNEPRFRTLQIGTAFGVGAMLMYFGGLIAMYISERSAFLRAQPEEGAASWIPATARIELTPPTIMFWTFAMSAPFMWWACHSFKNNDRKHAFLAVGLQMLMGAAVINQTVFQWTQMGLVADDVSTAAPVLIYAITGSFVVAVAGVMVYLLAMAFRAASTPDISINTGGISAVAVAWYALIAVYFVMWIAVFIAR